MNYETIVSYIHATTTKTGLKVEAYLNYKKYEKGIKITDNQMAELDLKYHPADPKLNYTISPQINIIEKDSGENCDNNVLSNN